MGRRKRSGKKGGANLNKHGSDVQVLYGHELKQNTVTGLTQVVLIPFNFTRALAMADNFQFYRFRRIKCTILPSNNGTSLSATIPQSIAMGYAPGPAPDTPPARQNDVVNLNRSSFMGRAATVPVKLQLGPKELIGDTPIKWYKTIAGAPDVQWEQQGVVYFYSAAATGASTLFDIMWDYEIEFQGLMVATSTPLQLCGPPSDSNSMVLYRGNTYMRIPPPIIG